MSVFKKNRIIQYSFTLLIIAGLTFLIFNDSGYIKYVKLKGEVNDVRNKVGQQELDNKNLEAEIDSLRKGIPAKIERVAREKYSMMKKGEKIIKVEEK